MLDDAGTATDETFYFVLARALNTLTSTLSTVLDMRMLTSTSNATVTSSVLIERSRSTSILDALWICSHQLSSP